MATTLKQNKLSVNLGNVVNNAIVAVKAVRAQESSRKESAFQSAVAEGLSYEAQVRFREQQLVSAAAEPFPDTDYIQRIKESIVSTKRLARFNAYRTKYAQALGEMNAGHINEVQYAERLKSLLGSASDPDLRLEIEGNITAAEARVTAYKSTILANQVKLANYDGTQKTLNGVIEKVKEARAIAAIGQNEDEVAEHDATLASLRSQLVQVKAEDVVNSLVVAGTFTAYSSKEKLNTLNAQIDGADTSTPVVINGKRYGSEREYWETTRNGYLSGNGTGIFSDYFNDLNTQNKSLIDGDVARYGFVPATTTQAIKSEFDTLKSRPEFAPFLSQVESLQAQTVGAAVDTMAKVIVERAEYTGEFVKADNALKSLTNLYGVDTSLQQLQLGARLSAQVNAVIEAGGTPPPGTDILPASEFPIPTTTTTTPPQEAAPKAEPTPTGGSYKVVSGDSLSKIAAQNNVTLTQLLDANPEYKANPSLIRPDAIIQLPKMEPVVPTPTPTSQPTQPIQPPVSTTSSTPTAPTATPTQTSTPTPSQPTEYSVIGGDTLSAIAAKNKTTVADLARINGITDVNKISIGQKIKLQ